MKGKERGEVVFDGGSNKLVSSAIKVVTIMIVILNE